MTKNRVPTSKTSWIGMAANEIDEITIYGASRAAKSARALADAVIKAGYLLLDTDPRATARANFGPEALRAKAEEEAAKEARSRHILGYDAMGKWLDDYARSRRVA